VAELADARDLVDAVSWANEVESIIHAGAVNRSVYSESTLQMLKMESTCPRLSMTAGSSKANYLLAVQQIKDHIESGDVYQVNLTRRFTAPFKLPPFETYLRLRHMNPAPFAAYLDYGSGFILSSSPERFVQIRNGRIQTRPIKGTRPRGKTHEEDLSNRLELINSEKDRSELLMIVDLERNDLGRICKPGSIHVKELFELEEYATVYHMVATVEGVLETDVDAVDCLKAVFPGGSITGAPKIRAMEIIDELEPDRRGIYTGAIGYIGFDGQADFNIAIRTIIIQQGQAFFSAGGGIVWDSDPKMEYDETLHKASALFETLNVVLCEEE
jgi:para-aminobenzoate synthetase component 1